MMQSTPLWQARTDPPEKDFKIDANGARAFTGHFPFGVETVRRFVNVRLHCKISNLKNVGVAPPPEKFLLTSGRVG